MSINPFKNVIEDVKRAGIELSGNKKMIISDCRYIADYSEAKIVLNIGRLDIEVIGDDLTLSGFSYGETCIEGTIVSICFREGEDRC